MGQDRERDRLLDAAKIVVLQRGLAISNRELAAAIGTSHRMLDYYFGGRAGLISAVLESWSNDLARVFAASVPPPGEPRSLAALAALAEVQGDPALAVLWLEVLRGALQGDEELAAVAQRITAAWHAWLTTTWGLDSRTADAALAAYEGSGVVAVTRGEAAGREALRRLLTALDEGRGHS